MLVVTVLSSDQTETLAHWPLATGHWGMAMGWDSHMADKRHATMETKSKYDEQQQEVRYVSFVRMISGQCQTLVHVLH